MKSKSGVPVVYAGRLYDQLVKGLPDGCSVLSDWDVLPRQLLAALENAPALAILDPLSFPFETMTEDHWNVPLFATLPSEFDAEATTAIFGSVLLEWLGPFDRILTANKQLWNELRHRYSWDENQRVGLEDDDPNTLALQTSRMLANLDQGSRFEKAAHRTEMRALESRFAAAREDKPGDVPPDVLEVGSGDGRQSMSFNPKEIRYSGTDADEELVRVARSNLPGINFDQLGQSLLIPHKDESFDLVFEVNTLRSIANPEKATLLREMWRVCRPLGRLVFLEDFVSSPRPGEAAGSALSVSEFVNAALGAVEKRMVLEHVESIRYPGETVVRKGLISFVKTETIGPE